MSQFDCASQARDTWGTPAPHLDPHHNNGHLMTAPAGDTRLSRMESSDSGEPEDGVTRALWSGTRGRTIATPHSGGATAAEALRGRAANAVLRRVMEKLNAKGGVREMWLRLNNNRDGKTDMRELRQGLARRATLYSVNTAVICSMY
jgi:hypothetical protein